jgi:hypothetical protein
MSQTPNIDATRANGGYLQAAEERLMHLDSRWTGSLVGNRGKGPAERRIAAPLILIKDYLG